MGILNFGILRIHGQKIMLSVGRDIPESFLERHASYWKPLVFESSGKNLKFYNDIAGEGVKRVIEPSGLKTLKLGCFKSATDHIKRSLNAAANQNSTRI